MTKKPASKPVSNAPPDATGTEQKTQGAYELELIRLRELLRNLKAVDYRMSLPDGKYEYISPDIEAVTGFTQDTCYNNPVLVQRAIHPDSIPYFQEKWGELMTGVIAPTYEYKLITPTGEERWILQSNNGVYDAEGKLVAIEGLMQDVTAQKHLEGSITRAFSLFETGPIMIFRWQNAPGWPVEYVSRNITDILGYPAEKLISGEVPYASIVHPDDLAKTADEVAAYSAAGVQSFSQEYRLLTATGEARWLYDQTRIVRDNQGNITHYDGYMQDITERKAAETALEASRHNLRAVFDSVHDAIFIHDLDGSIIDVNQRMMELYGVSREEASTFSIAEDYSAPENPLEDLSKTWETVVAGKTAVFEWKARRPHTGAVFDAQVVLRRISLEDRDVILANIRDISERKTAAAERERFASRLNVASEIATQVQAILDPEELLQAVIPLIKERFGLYYVHVYTVDEAAGELKLRAGYGEPGRAMVERGHSIPLDREASLVATAARTQAPVLVQDVTENPDFMPNPLLPDTKSEVAVPAIAGGKVLGVFDVQHDKTHYFTDADLDVFQTLAGQIAGAFQNAELFAQVEQNLQETEVRLNVSRALAGAETEQQVWDTLLSQSGLYLEAALGLYAFEEEDGKKIQVTRAFGSFDTDIAEEAIGTRFPADEFEVTAIVATGASFITDNIFTDDRMGAGMKKDARKLGYTSLAATPMMLGDTIVGLIVAHSPQEGYFDQEKLNLYATLAEQGAVALQAARLNEAMHMNEERLSMALRAGRVGIWEFWPQQNKVYYNPTWYTMLGYAPYELPQDLNTWAALLHPEDAPRANEVVMAGVQAGEDFHLQFRMKTKSGEWRWIQAHGYVTERTPEGMGERLIGTHTDITEQHLAEESLRANEERLSLALESGRVGIWEFWPQKNEVYFNPTWYTMLGYEPYELTPDLGTWAALLHPDDAAHASEIIQQSVQSGTDFHMQFRMKTKAGDWRWIQAHGYVTEHTPEGMTARVIGTHTDIHEQKMAEAESQAAAAQQQTILETTPVGIAITRVPDNVVLYVNSEFNAILGYTEAAVLHKAVPDFYYNEADSQKAFELMMAQNGVLENYEVYARRADGTPLWLSLSLKPITYNNQPASLAAFVDITERKTAEAAILQEKTTSDAIINSLPTLFYLYDQNGALVRWNQRYEEAFGYSPEEIVKLTVIDTIAEEDRALVGERMTEVFTVGSSQTEAKILTKDGQKIPYLLTGTRLNIGDAAYLVGAGIDLSELKQAEIERERFAARLNVASEIAAQVQSILDPDELLQAVIPLIKERFGLYYVHVYTVDEAAGELKLRAGYGEPGRIMVEQGHSIPLDREASLVATAARTKEPVLVQDVTANPNFLPNPLLPDTKSEVAVPAIAGGKVLGVFDVQHDEAHYFTQADLDIFIAMAGQIATAFQNAELYVQAEHQRVLYDGILTNLPTAVFAVDNQFGLLVTNEAAQKLLGRPMTDKEGNVYTEQYDVVVYETGERFPEDELPLVKANVLGGKHANSELAVRHPDGTLIPLMINAGPLLDPAGKQMGAVVTFTDMTDQRKAQDAVERARTLYDGILTNLPTAVFAVDSQFNLLVTNEAAQNLLGQQMTDKEGNVYVEQYDVVYYDTGERFPEDELPLVKANTQGGQHANDVMAVRQADGTLVPILVNAGPLLDPAGKQMGAVVTFTDMTDQRQAQNEALAQAARSRALLETIPDMMFLFDQTGVFLDFKAEAGQELYVKPEFFLGRKINEVLPPSIANPTLENLRKALETGELCSYIYQAPVGEELHTYEARLGRVSPTTALGLVRDITERQHAQAERERFAAQLGTAAEIARQVGTILDTDILLNTVIPLLKERFGLYHAQVYVHEAATGDLVLRAGYGAVGQIMLEQGHRITAEQEDSLVHRAAATKDVVLANDVLQEADFMPNLLLPETRAEVAVPAMIGDQVVGVFDVQSDQINFFTDADLDVYRTLAGQIASAFQTARLFEQQQGAQQALRIAVEKTRAIFEAMTEGLVVTGMMGKIEDLNDATLRLHGFSNRDEVVGRSAMQLFERAYWSKAAETMRHAMEVGRSELAEYQMVRSDHSTFEAEMNAALLRDADGKPAGFVNIVRDITDRKRAEAERARFAAELRTAADISSQVTSILDPQELLDRVVTLMKEQFNLYHVHIYTLDSGDEALILTASYGETGRVLVSQAEAIPLTAEDNLAVRAVRNKEIVVIEDVTEAPDFMPNPLLPETRSQVAVPAMFGDKVLGAFEVMHNEANYFTQADLDVFRTLSGQVAASFQNARYFEEIQQAAERLREMDVLKSEFLANMSHELRTPLNSIIGYAEVMLMGIDSGLEGETLQDVQAIYDNGQHLLHLINDVLDLAKIEAGHMILDKEDVAVAALLEDVQTHNAGLLVNKPVEFVVEASEDLPTVLADRLRLNQILNNLVSNAVKFTEKGHIKLRAYLETDWMCIDVEDTGVGISANHLDIIFERFRQADGSNARAAEGTGLGLSITQHLVEMHHGTMHVQSKVGAGSTFTVKLPLNPPMDEEKFKFV